MLLEEHPELGTVAEDLVPRGSFRHFPSPPYRVIYRLTDDEIWIARVWDTRRDPADLRVPDNSRSPDGEKEVVPPTDEKPAT